MNKIRVTKKQIKDGCYKNELIKVGYCELQNLLCYDSPFAYSCGVQSWSCDYYKVGHYIISTGYNPVGTTVPNELIIKIEQIAKLLPYNEEKRKTIEILKDQFCDNLDAYFNNK